MHFQRTVSDSSQAPAIAHTLAKQPHTNNIKTKFLHHRPDGESLGRLMKLYQQGKLPLLPVEVLPLEAAVEAHKRSESRHTRGKLVLKVRDM